MRLNKAPFSTGLLILLVFGAVSAFAEAVFLKDGSILDGKILKETKESTRIQLAADNAIKMIPATDILRTLYNDEYKNMVNIVKLNGESVKCHIVYEDAEYYLVREDLASAKERKILKKEVNGILKKLKEPAKKELVLKTEKDTYTTSENPVALYENFPGSRYDWVSISPKNTPDEYYTSYQYTGGGESGKLVFEPVTEPGDYELRAYLHWSEGSYKVSKRFDFKVK